MVPLYCQNMISLVGKPGKHFGNFSDLSVWLQYQGWLQNCMKNIHVHADSLSFFAFSDHSTYTYFVRNVNICMYMHLTYKESVYHMSRPAPGRDYSCCSGIPGFGIGRGQGRGKLY